MGKEKMEVIQAKDAQGGASTGSAFVCGCPYIVSKTFDLKRQTIAMILESRNF